MDKWAMDIDKQFIQHCSHPVVFCFAVGGIGDFLVHLPTLNALVVLFANQLTVVCERSRYYPIIVHMSGVRVIPLDCWTVDRESQFNVQEAFSLIGRCDVLISFNADLGRSTRELIAKLNPQWSLGFRQGFSEVLRYKKGQHITNLPFQVPRWFDPSINLVDHAYLPIGIKDRDRSQELMRQHTVSQRTVVFHTDTNPAKMWGHQHWVSVINELLRSQPNTIAIVLGVYAEPLVKAFTHNSRVVSLVGLPLATSVAVLRHADLFMGVDSCLLHAADLCGVPGIALFGPTDPVLWGFYFSRHEHVVSDKGIMETIVESSVICAMQRMLQA